MDHEKQLTQEDEKDHALLMALFNDFVEDAEKVKEDYLPLKDYFNQANKLGNDSGLGLMFCSFCAGIDKGLEIALKVDEIAETRKGK